MLMFLHRSKILTTGNSFMAELKNGNREINVCEINSCNLN